MSFQTGQIVKQVNNLGRDESKFIRIIKIQGDNIAHIHLNYPDKILNTSIKDIRELDFRDIIELVQTFGTVKI